MKTKTIECKYCKGSGMVQIAQNSRGLKTCPYCNGKKQLKMKWVDYDAGEDCYEDEHKGHWEIIK